MSRSCSLLIFLLRALFRSVSLPLHKTLVATNKDKTIAHCVIPQLADNKRRDDNPTKQTDTWSDDHHRREPESKGLLTASKCLEDRDGKRE